MGTTKTTYSYHVQLALLTKAHVAMKEALSLLERAFDNEITQVGVEEASGNAYGELARETDYLADGLEAHVQAVKALAEMTPPDLVIPKDPTDYAEDERFQRMITDAFDIAAASGVRAKDVVTSLNHAVGEGDQR